MDSVLVAHVMKANLNNKMRFSSGAEERIQKILEERYRFELGYMIYQYKDVGRSDPVKGVNKPFKNASCERRTQKFVTNFVVDLERSEVGHPCYSTTHPSL